VGPRLVALGLLLVSGCAGLGPRTRGQTEVVTWQATDLKLEERDVGGQKLWYYSFELLIEEVRGRALTFDRIETTIYQPGTGSWTGRYQGTWTLAARDRFRIPLQSTLSCHPGSTCTGPNVPIPLWHIVMQGMDGQGQAVRTVIDLSLPADPPVTPERTTPRSVPAIILGPGRR
jgi:hypothetical protein